MAEDLERQLQASLGPDFRLDRELGGGGMSRVFLAEERQLGRRVVVKVLSPALSAGLSADRFEREIRLAAQLQDPRIVPLLQAGHAGDLRFYTMPYVEGESLRARLDRGPIADDEALGILRDVALALEHAHAHQVVHRDIKPQNILLSGRTAMVADFGIARAISAAAEVGSGGTLTDVGGIIGTPAYMSPEQAAGDAVDFRADLYAWGMVAYEMLAGVHPFAARTTPRALLAAQIAEPPSPLAKRRPDLPVALTTLVDRCLAKEPGVRPGDASSLLAELTSAERNVASRGLRVAPAYAVLAAVVLGVLGTAGAWLYRRSREQEWAREQAVPEAGRLQSADRSLAAVLLLERARSDLPADTAIAHAYEKATEAISITSSPPGAQISIQDYVTPDSSWHVLGTTPIASIRVPAGYFRWRIAKAGVGQYIAAPDIEKKMRFTLDSVVSAPRGMVYVPATTTWEDYIGFVGWTGPDTLPAFYVDRFEVTNREYQGFVDKGGYATQKYWTEPFVEDGRRMTWEQAMALFRDRTQRAGPSTWEGGHYPEGQGDYPVSGVSWYEAAAYAAFAGKTLPAFSQWYMLAPGYLARFVVPQSNISRSSLARAGAFHGLGWFGTYDMAGNVREWTLNAFGADRRFILGGKWDSPSYLYADPESLSPFDRSAGNGIRCVRNLGPLPAAATRPIRPLERDFSKVRPATDAVFRTYQAMYAYVKTPLDAKVEGIVGETADWREQKVSFNTAYGDERMAAYLFLPKRVRPPYQTVVFFPSARVLFLRDNSKLGDIPFFDYVVQSGRAVMYPVYQDTYERRLFHSMPGEMGQLNLSVQRYQDLARSLDYLETRPDIAKNEFVYMGVSMGSAEGVVYATLAQDRLKTVIFLDGGFFLDRPPAAMDQANFAPRLKKPVLMVNGRYDFTFLLQQSQIPLFQMLGTPDAEKKHVVMDTPHDVLEDRPTLVREVLSWLDRYLGPVQ